MAGPVVALAVGRRPARAVDPIPVCGSPQNRSATALPCPCRQGITFDLDGDGIKELVTIGAAADAQGLSAVVPGGWTPTGLRPRATRSAAARRERGRAAERSRGAGIDRDEMIAVQTVEPAAFHRPSHGRGVLFVAAIGTHAEQPVPCCLTIWEVLPSGDHAIDLERVADTRTRASS